MKCVYFARAVGTTRIKVGQTDDVTRRLKDIQVGCPFDLRLIGTVSTNVIAEHEVKRGLSDFRIRGEWFKYTPAIRRMVEMLTSGDVVKIAAACRWVRSKEQEPATVKLKIEPDEKEGFKEAAEIEGIALSAWVRQGLRRLARNVLEEAGRPVPFLSKHQAVKGKNR